MTRRTSRTKPEHFDVLIIGAGISGLGAAYELRTQCPHRSMVVLEAMESFGGTWRWHKYPGIRSDSDLFTFGFRFKAWLGPPIATRDEILKYLGEVIDDNNMAPHIRYRHKIETASWSSERNVWQLEARVGPDGDLMRYTCDFLWMCQGYYRHAQGHTPFWPGMDDYQGRLVHPQTWPDDLDYRGKRVIIVGSGATAATLVPAIAADCAQVIMLQRSPTYFFPHQNRNKLADTLRSLDLDPLLVHGIVRRKVVYDQRRFLDRAMREPEAVKEELLAGVAAHLPEDVVAEHFTPTYRPWQQRIAVIPDGDLFAAVRDGQASVVTDQIARFTPTGVELKSGRELEADIVVTATGFDLAILGDIAFSVDGRRVSFAETVSYRGMMFTDMPNMAWIFGYFRAASWTLRVDLVTDFICRMLNHMQAIGAARVRVELCPDDLDMELAPFVDTSFFNPGYLMRSLDLLPRAGDKPEWRHSQDYSFDQNELPAVDLDGACFDYADRQGRPLNRRRVQGTIPPR
jgi:cation diffusion facilitator CzcD-associated flavoprotein CzcO